MRHARLSLCLLFLGLIVLVTGCGSVTDSGGGGTFTLGADPAVTIAQGQSLTFTVTPTSANQFTGSVQVSVNGLPSGVMVSPANATVAVGASATFKLTAAADAAVGTSTVKVFGASGSLSTNTSVALTVTATPVVKPPAGTDFTLTAAPSTLTLTPSASAAVTLSSTALGGFDGTIVVAVTGLPTGVTVSPATITVTPNNPTTITLMAASDAPATTTPVRVSFAGTSGTLSHTASIQLTIPAIGPTGPDFTITATPATMTVAQGTQSGEVQVAVTGSNGFAGDVMFKVSGLPTGVTVVPPSSTLHSGWTEPIVFEAATDAAPGNATVTITGTSGVLTHTATVALTVTAPPPPDFVTLNVSPASQTITVGSVGTVSVTANAGPDYAGTVNVSVQDLPAGVTMLPATAALVAGVAQKFTLVASPNAAPGETTATFVGQVNSVNGTADLHLTIVNPTNSGNDVPTWHNDMARTGLNANETILTPAKVNAATFVKAGIKPTDGAVDAQPLYISGLTIGTQTLNVLYVATENDTVYAFNASSGTQLWKTPVLGPDETAADNHGCSELPLKVGITSTPVIDRNFAPNGAIFFVAKTIDSGGTYHQRLHALDLTTGAELRGGPVDIAGTNTFDPGVFVEEAALLVNNGLVYLSWAAPCQETSSGYSGLAMAYNEGTLEQLSTLNVAPNGSGGSISMSGAGPAADANGDVFLITSKGTFDTALDTNGRPKYGDYGNGYLKIQSPNGVMTVLDYFEPLNGVPGAANYQDQGSGGVMLVSANANPAQGTSLAIGAGKDGSIYQMTSQGNELGEYDGTEDNDFFTLANALPNGATSSPAYFNGAVYYGGSNDALREFTLSTSNATLASRSANTLGAAGATPVISANGTNGGILWALDTTASGGAVLHAYDATNLATELYNSTQAQVGGAPRDWIGTTSNHAIPLVANGFVYIGTDAGLAIFGLLQ
jgi:hypothetical protein